MPLIVVTPPAVEPITVDEARSHLRAPLTGDDAFDEPETAYIETLIAVARETVETLTARALISQTLRAEFDAFPRCGVFRLERGRVQSVTDITYTDREGTTQTLAPARYVEHLSKTPAEIRLAYGATWPDISYDGGDIAITYVAGYGVDASAIPGPLMHAMKLLIGHWYAFREPVITGTIVNEIPKAVEFLCMPHRVWTS